MFFTPSEAECPPSEAEVGWLYTSDSRLGYARRAVCEPFVHRAEPRSVPRAEPRGTYTPDSRLGFARRAV